MPRRYWTAITLMLSIVVLYTTLSFLFSSSGNGVVVTTDDDLSYGIVIDAGSTGSRLFLYAFTSGSDKELISVKPVKDENNEDVIKKVSPGLSSFGDNPDGAPEYIKPLLNYASKYIPYEQQPSTPIFIFATAGMRLLPKASQDSIVNSLRTRLPELTRLQVLPEHIQVIDGKWEGIYSWIAVNYVLGRFNVHDEGLKRTASETPLSARDKTAGMIDMGGASVQIAFELPQKDAFTTESVQHVNLGCHDNDPRFLYKLFVTTFLGFGVNEGAKKYEGSLGSRIQMGNESALVHLPYVRDNCLPANMLRIADREKASDFVRVGTGDWDSCVGELVTILKGAGDCTHALKCFFGGVAAPSVDLSSIELYGFSEYWYSMHDVLTLGGRYDHNEFERSARKFCSTKWKDIKAGKLYPENGMDRLEAQCFKSAWIHAILHDGFHVSELENHFQSALRIRNQEVQWALGALIYQLRYYPLRLTNPASTSASTSSNGAFSGLLLPVLVVGAAAAAILVIVGVLQKKCTPNGNRPSTGNVLPAFMRRDPTSVGYKRVASDSFVFRGNMPA